MVLPGERRRTQPMEPRTAGEWARLRRKLVVEVQFEHFTGGRFRHGTRFWRRRPEKEGRFFTFKPVERESRSVLDLL